MVLTSSDGRQQVAQHVVEIRLDDLQFGRADRYAVAEIVDHGGIGWRFGPRMIFFAKRFADTPSPGRDLPLARAGRRTAAARLCRRRGNRRGASMSWLAIAAAAIGKNNHVCCTNIRRRATGIDLEARWTIPPRASIGDEESL